MRIVIVGAGEVGNYLGALLSNRGHDVTIVESTETIASKVDEELNVRVVAGNGASAEVLLQAEVDNCDYFLAMTSDDKTNLIATSLAKALGAKTTITRIHDQTYIDTSLVNYQVQFGIDHMINPEGLCAVELAKAIRSAGRVAVENFARGQVEVQQVRVQAGSKLIGRTLKEAKISPKARIGYIQRQGQNYVPSAESELAEGDLLTLFGAPENLYEVRSRFEPGKNTGQVRMVLFGGGEIAIGLVRLLTNPRFKIRIIEKDPVRSRKLAEKFPNVTVIQGDATSLRLMEEEQVGAADYFVACTKDDENNIVTCLQASKLGAKHVQAVINKSDYEEVLGGLREALGVELFVSPRVATANEVLRYISQAPYIELADLPENGGRIVEIRVSPDSPAAGKLIREIPWPSQSLVAAIQHKFKVRVPTADEQVLPGDRVLIITRPDNIKTLLRLLRND